MRWIIDVDGRAPSRGAIRFASSLARASDPGDGERFVPVHVLAQDHLRSALRMHHLDEVVDDARSASARVLADATKDGGFSELEVVQALYEEEGLAAVREAHDADGVILGRDDRHVLRLGRVARRLLRDLPCPVVVVPPDLSLSESAGLDGPILALTDLRAHSEAALRFAAKLARDTGRELWVVHAAGRDSSAKDEGAVAAWAAAGGLPADRCVVMRGEVVQAALELADSHAALALVVGSRPRSGLERVVGRSVGRALAARAARPVIVVPPGEVRREAAAEASTTRAPVHA